MVSVVLLLTSAMLSGRVFTRPERSTATVFELQGWVFTSNHIAHSDALRGP